MSDNLLLFITVLVNTSRKLTQVTRIHPKLNIEGSWSLSNPYVGDFFLNSYLQTKVIKIVFLVPLKTEKIFL